MVPNRRELLKGIGVGVTISLIGLPTAADGTDRVFVHPRTGLLRDVLNAIDTIGGTPVLEYDNFEFVTAEIPSDKRDELLSDVRVAFIEDDAGVGIPSEWAPSIPDILDPGGDIDCSAHPEQRPSWGWERIGVDTVALDGSGVDVGILDTGIESDHCSLAVAGGRNVTDSGLPNDYEDDHGHGTHVAGIAGALDNGIGVVGVAPKTNMYAVKVLDGNGSGRYSNLVAGIDWCMSNDVELISMSLGGESGSSTVDQAIEEAHSAGHLLLSAAGNNQNNGDGSCDEETMSYPATHDDVVAVSAMNEDDTLASYSSVGTAINLLAPGTDINSTYVNNEYAQASGTSVACPFVTGVAALLWQGRSEEAPGTNNDVRYRLTQTAETVLGTCEEGHGLVDARTAVGEGQDIPDDDREEADTGQGDPPDHEDEQRDSIGQEGDLPSILDRIIEVVADISEWIRGLFR